MRKKTHWSTSIYWIDMKEEKINSTDHIRKLSFSFDFIFGESKCYKRGREKKRNKYSLSGQLHSPKIKVPKTSKIFSSLLRTHAKVHHLHFNGNDRVLFFFFGNALLQWFFKWFCVYAKWLSTDIRINSLRKFDQRKNHWDLFRFERTRLISCSFIVLWRKKIQVFLSRFQWKQRIGWAIRNGRGKERMNRTRAYFSGILFLSLNFDNINLWSWLFMRPERNGKKWNFVFHILEVRIVTLTLTHHLNCVNKKNTPQRNKRTLRVEYDRHCDDHAQNEMRKFRFFCLSFLGLVCLCEILRCYANS